MTSGQAMLTLTGLEGMGPQRLAVPSGWSSQYTIDAPGRICSARSWTPMVQVQPLISVFGRAGQAVQSCGIVSLLQVGDWRLDFWAVQVARQPIHMVAPGRLQLPAWCMAMLRRPQYSFDPIAAPCKTHQGRLHSSGIKSGCCGVNLSSVTRCCHEETSSCRSSKPRFVCR